MTLCGPYATPCQPYADPMPATLLCCLGYQIVSIIGVLTFGNKINFDPFRHAAANNYLHGPFEAPHRSVAHHFHH